MVNNSCDLISSPHLAENSEVNWEGDSEVNNSCETCSQTKVQIFLTQRKIFVQYFGCKARRLYKHFGCKAKLLFEHFGCKERFLFIHYMDAKEDFCTNVCGDILGAKQVQTFWMRMKTFVTRYG